LYRFCRPYQAFNNKKSNDIFVRVHFTKTARKVFNYQIIDINPQRNNTTNEAVGCFSSEAGWSTRTMVESYSSAIDQNMSHDCRRLIGLFSGRLKLALIGRSSGT